MAVWPSLVAFPLSRYHRHLFGWLPAMIFVASVLVSRRFLLRHIVLTSRFRHHCSMSFDGSRDCFCTCRAMGTRVVGVSLECA